MKLPKLIPGKKLQATARRVRAGVAERAPERAVAEYDEEEPAMRFSSAFMVVLLLHVTAFGGIYAFDHIKARRTPAPAGASVAKTEATAPATEVSATAPATKVEATSSIAKARSEQSEKAPVTAEKRETPERPAASAKPAVYTVVKGDNPVTIAHHFGVSYDELLKVNNIEDPKKLQIGQKLRIPGKKLGETSGKLTSQAHTNAAE